MWTLKFKRDKVTVVLFVHPDQSMLSIKDEFLEALKSRNTTFEDQDIPSSSDEVFLAKLTIPNDHESGWETLTSASESIGSSDAKGSKKRKANGSNPLDSPVGLGLKDGAVLAFKFQKIPESDADSTLEAGDYVVSFAPLDVDEAEDELPSEG